MPITSEQLAVDFFPRVGFASPEGRASAWKQLHVATGALAVLGRDWGEPRDDGSHAALVWNQQDAGWLAQGRGGLGEVIGWLDLGGASLWIERREPQEGAWIELEGRTPAEVAAWVGSAAERLTGKPGGRVCLESTNDQRPFAVFDTDSCADLEALYEGAGLLLTTLLGVLGSDEGDEAPRVWPGRFIAECRIVLSCDEQGHALRTIRVGLSPPDDIEPAGYWHVELDEGTEQSTDLCADLPHGRWQKRAGSSAIAVLSLTELIHLEDGGDQQARVAGFIAAGFNACELMSDS